MSDAAKKVSGFLSGKKTYLVGGGFVVLGGAILFGWIEPTEEQFAAAVTLLLGFGEVAKRLALAKIQKATEKASA